MMPPNDMPADTELREILLSHDFRYPDGSANEKELADAIALLKARDAAIRIDEHNHIRWRPDEAKYIEAQADRITELSTPTDQKEKAK